MKEEKRTNDQIWASVRDKFFPDSAIIMRDDLFEIIEEAQRGMIPAENALDLSGLSDGDAESVRAYAQATREGHAEGIEIFVGSEWRQMVADGMTFLGGVHYRIKPAPTEEPSAEEPKYNIDDYRPWTPEEGIGKTVEDTDTSLRLITQFYGGVFWCGCSQLGTGVALFKNLKQPDGTPCGELKSEPRREG